MNEPDLEPSDAALVQRAAECWQAGAPTSTEIRRATRRFAARGVSRRPVGRLLAVALVQGFAVGIVTVAAASWVVLRSVSPAPSTASVSDHAEGRSSSSPKRGARVGPHAEVPSAPAPEAPSAAFAAVVEQRASGSALGSGPSQPSPETTSAGARAEARPASGPVARASSGAQAVPSTPLSAPPPPSAGAGAVDGRWARVAEALSVNDFRSAERALAELERSSDAATRDAAELARAQLHVANGGGEPFRPSIERLAREGSTPLVRRRAAELLGVLGAAPRGTVPR